MKKYGRSKEHLDWLKQGDFMLMNMAYDKAIKKGEKTFQVPISGFEGSPEWKTHLSQFCVEKGVSYKSNGVYFVFQIPD